MSVRIAGAYLSQLRKDIEFSFVFQPANFLQVTRESLLLDLKLESLMSVLHEVLDANKKYVESFGEKGKLALPPARQFAVLTCMDARLDPAKYAGLAEGDAHVIGTKEWFVIHHSNCGMEFFTDEIMRGLLAKSLETAALGEQGFYDVGKGPGSTEAAYIDWLTIADRNKAVVEDVERIRRHPLVPKNIPIHGFVYEVETGKLLEVPGAKEAGAAK